VSAFCPTHSNIVSLRGILTYISIFIPSLLVDEPLEEEFVLTPILLLNPKNFRILSKAHGAIP
jgi:hypothetical protein